MTSDPIQTLLRVMNWNIWWQFGPWQERAPAILAALKAAHADVIALQEVWDDGSRNFAKELADDLGYHYAYAPGAKMNGTYMGNAILSRWPIVNHDITPLYGEDDIDENRVAIFAEIDGPRGRIPVFCTHLNWQQHQSHIRQKQVIDLCRFINAKRHKNHYWKFPPVLCGDFNADFISEEIRMLTGQTTCADGDLVFHDAWTFANSEKVGFTWNNINPHVPETYEPNRRLDYIFTGFAMGRGAGNVVGCQIVGDKPVDGVWPSDHFALLAELRY